jgi:hypothetical protein
MSDKEKGGKTRTEKINVYPVTQNGSYGKSSVNVMNDWLSTIDNKDHDLLKRSRYNYYTQRIDSVLYGNDFDKYQGIKKGIVAPNDRIKYAEEAIKSGSFNKNLGDKDIEKILGPEQYKDFVSIRPGYVNPAKVAGTKNVDPMIYGIRNSFAAPYPRYLMGAPEVGGYADATYYPGKGYEVKGTITRGPKGFAKGGIVKPGDGETIALHGNELLIGPDGTTQEVQAPTDPSGAPLTLSPGTSVISPNFINKAKSIAAKQAPEIKKLSKIIKDPKSTTLERATAKRRMDNLRKQYDPILRAQELDKVLRGTPTITPEGMAGAKGGLMDAFNPISMVAKGAGTLYNLGMGLFSKVDTLNAENFQNPYEAQIRSNMANRSFNADPMLEGNRTAAASAAYNIRNSGMGGGALASNMLGAQNARMRADAQAYATKQQADNQYRQEQAVMDASLGQQRAATNLQINQINQQAKAAKRNYLATAFGQGGQLFQNEQLMKNQQTRDADMMSRYKEWMGLMGGGKPTASQTMAGYGQSALLGTLGGFKGSITPQPIFDDGRQYKGV